MATMTTMEIDDLSALSERLKTLTDDLNASIESIETRINRLNLGVEAWVTKKPLKQHNTESWTNEFQQPSRHRVAVELGYTKLQDGWGLAVRTVHYLQTLDLGVSWDDACEDIVSDPKPLLRATRTLRATAVDRIPDLIEALHEAGSKLVDAVEQARRVSESLKK